MLGGYYAFRVELCTATLERIKATSSYSLDKFLLPMIKSSGRRKPFLQPTSHVCLADKEVTLRRTDAPVFLLGPPRHPRHYSSPAGLLCQCHRSTVTVSVCVCSTDYSTACKQPLREPYHGTQTADDPAEYAALVTVS